MPNEEIIQTSFCNVNTNNASAGLRENAILTNFGDNILVANMCHNMQKGWGDTRGEHT